MSPRQPWPASWSAVRWPGNPRVHGVFTSRDGGCSGGAWAAGDGGGGMNLASHVGDEAAAVLRNRELLAQRLGGVRVAWLEQVHGAGITDLDAWHEGCVARADAAVVTRAEVAACVLVADCLPVLFAAPDGRGVAAAHAGWRGLAAGVLERTAQTLAQRAACRASQLQAWLGPAIGPSNFEVGAEVREAFVGHDGLARQCFVRGRREGKWMADLFGLARLRLADAGVLPESIRGGGICTVANPGLYYSFRRDGTTGRQAGLIWLGADGGQAR